MYTPQLSDFSVISLRRLAWAMGTTMGAAFTRMVRLMPTMVDPGLVCQCCKDRSKCAYCAFSKQVTADDKAALTTI
jgi:hypothetical protein